MGNVSPCYMPAPPAMAATQTALLSALQTALLREASGTTNSWARGLTASSVAVTAVAAIREEIVTAAAPSSSQGGEEGGGISPNNIKDLTGPNGGASGGALSGSVAASSTDNNSNTIKIVALCCFGAVVLGVCLLLLYYWPRRTTSRPQKQPAPAPMWKEQEDNSFIPLRFSPTWCGYTKEKLRRTMCVFTMFCGRGFVGDVPWRRLVGGGRAVDVHTIRVLAICEGWFRWSCLPGGSRWTSLFPRECGGVVATSPKGVYVVQPSVGLKRTGVNTDLVEGGAITNGHGSSSILPGTTLDPRPRQGRTSTTVEADDIGVVMVEEEEPEIDYDDHIDVPSRGPDSVRLSDRVRTRSDSDSRPPAKLDGGRVQQPGGARKGNRPVLAPMSTRSAANIAGTTEY